MAGSRGNKIMRRKVRSWLERRELAVGSLPGYFFQTTSLRQYVELALRAIDQVPGLLQRLAEQVELAGPKVIKLGAFPSPKVSSEHIEHIGSLFDKYGSDKSERHNYQLLYGALFEKPEAVSTVIEIGLGTNNVDVPSNMGRNGQPGASLRAFRDFFPSAEVFGADIDERILFTDERIRTCRADQTADDGFDALDLLVPGEADLIIDDGLHSPHANLRTLLFGLGKVSVGGWVVVEDINPAAQDLWQVVGSVIGSQFDAYLLEAEEGMLFAAKRSS